MIFLASTTEIIVTISILILVFPLIIFICNFIINNKTLNEKTKKIIKIILYLISILCIGIGIITNQLLAIIFAFIFAISPFLKIKRNDLKKDDTISNDEMIEYDEILDDDEK